MQVELQDVNTVIFEISFTYNLSLFVSQRPTYSALVPIRISFRPPLHLSVPSLNWRSNFISWHLECSYNIRN
jgi:hypothetical protein